MASSRVTSSALGILAVVATLVACAPPNPLAPSTQDLIGTWVNGSTRLVLEADATFSLVGAPSYTAVGQGDTWMAGDGATRDETGEWSIEPDGVRLDGEKLYFGEVESESTLEWGLDLGSDDPRC